jgi:pimeloyl-ACP methyl ester carboxylesterase
MPAVHRTPPAFAPANGLKLCYDTFGDPAAPSLLLIMGLAAQMVAWDDEFCTLLATRGYRVIRFDNRDIGLSSRIESAGVPDVSAAFMAAMQGKPIPAPPYLLTDMADDVVGLLDALDIPSAHVVGASMGGAIAQTLAIHHPERMRTLTSIMATTGEPGLPPPTADALAVLFKPTPTDQAAYFESYVQTWKVLRAGSFPLDEERDLSRAGQNFARGLNPAGVARQLVAILASEAASRRSARCVCRPS